MILASIELSVLIVYVLMVVGFIVMVWGIKNMNKQSIARIVMIVGVVMVLGGVVGRAVISPNESEDARLSRNSKIILSAKAEKAAEYIVNRFQENGATVAFLIDEISYNNTSSDNYFVLDSLKQRLGEKGATCLDVLIVGEKAIDKKTGEEKTEDPLDATIMKKKLDQVYDQADIVVNFVGLPDSATELKKITFLTKKNAATGKNNMLLMCDLGLPYVEQDMLTKSRVCAIIDYIRTGTLPDLKKESVPKNLSETFDMFYYLIDESTLSDFLGDNPRYFVSM
jgi:hypothetical protein